MSTSNGKLKKTSTPKILHNYFIKLFFVKFQSSQNKVQGPGGLEAEGSLISKMWFQQIAKRVQPKVVKPLVRRQEGSDPRAIAVHLTMPGTIFFF